MVINLLNALTRGVNVMPIPSSAIVRPSANACADNRPAGRE